MSRSHRLIQVVPRLTPARCGVSDHAIALAAELSTGRGIDSAFVVLNSEERPEIPFPVKLCPPARLRDACIELSRDKTSAILVHLSGYGYSEDGAPTLLAAALEQVKASSQFPIAVFFHELHASGMPWTSAFWYGQRQKQAYLRIAQLCDLRITSARVFASWIERKTAKFVQCMPVFSQVGEAQQLVPFSRRNPAMAVFGLAETRQKVYAEINKMGDTLAALGVREILDVGPSIETPRDVNGIQVQRAGTLAPAEIDRLLAKMAFGYLAYPPNCLAKSGVFAAYTAHGVIPVIAESFRGQFDGLKDGVHVLSSRTAAETKPENFDNCSQAAWRWYSGHKLCDHAAVYEQWLRAAERTMEHEVVQRHG